MRPNFLVSGPVDRSQTSTLQYKIIRGTLTHLLLTNTLSWHYKDKITVKLRHAGGMTTVVDRVSALTLCLLTDLKQGFPTTGTPDYIGDAGADGENNDNKGFVVQNAGVRIVMNAILLPLGHITLMGKEELEVTIECAVQTAQGGATLPTGKLRISSIVDKTRVDTLYCYDVSGDLESQEGNVREIYLVGKKGVSFFNTLANSLNSAPVGKDITVKLSVDGDDTENDVETYGALTAITCQLTSAPNNLLLVYRDFESVAAHAYVKVFGDDKDTAELLYVRETVVPHMVGQSIATGFDKELRRIEKFEADSPDQARALQQTGKIASSESMKIAADNFVAAVPAPTK